MPSRREFRCGGLRLALTAVCLSLPACSKTDGQPRDSQPQDREAKQSARALKLSIGKCTLIGNFRKHNDDAIAVKELPGTTLCLAADGMGGEVGGKVLGQVACERAIAVLTRELKKDLSQAATPEAIRKAIRRAVVAANEDIMALAGNGPNQVMGTTVVLALWHRGTGMYIAGVGDSRAYAIRGDQIEQLTVDHSLAQALVENKTITAEEAKAHRFRNVLWKYLGSKEVGEGPEVKVVALRPRDRILLCTDGIHAAVADDRILRFMAKHADVQNCADGLCQFAIDAGSRDNVSCIVIEVVESK
jgi:protein phosphatase